MKRLKIGIIGCGLITQVEHLPNLLALPELFEVVGVVDPSAKVRRALAERYGVGTFPTADDLFTRELDCVVIATPDAYHVELTIAALGRGLNVFVEKPLGYDPADADRVISARDAAKRVVQLGYMKRFDPAYLALCDLMHRHGGRLKAVNVEVFDPDFWPFTAHRTVHLGDDVPENLIRENGSKRAEQIERALGFAPSRDGAKGFAGPLCSSIVHDVNLVAGALAAIGETIAEPKGATLFDDDAGVSAIATASNGAPISLNWHTVPKLAWYSERLTFAFEDAVFELKFPSPYLNHQPTELIERRSDGLHLSETLHRPSYEEPFVTEMRAFHAAANAGRSDKNTVEDARRDIALLVAFARLALAHEATP
jgi:predicted dehydrogenase